MDKLKLGLAELQAQTIGLFKNKHTKKIELVTAVANNMIMTVEIGTLGGINEAVIDHSVNGEFKRFPNNQSLYKMLWEPFKLDEFIKSFN